MAKLKLYTDKRLNTFKELFDKVKCENIIQLKKWGVQTKTAFEWLSYLTEEIGELSQAIQDSQYEKDSATINNEHVIAEAIQAATLALKIAEMFGGKNG